MSEKFYQCEINEYCRDSKQYLIYLSKRINKTDPNIKENIFINTADIKFYTPTFQENC